MGERKTEARSVQGLGGGGGNSLPTNKKKEREHTADNLAKKNEEYRPTARNTETKPLTGGGLFPGEKKREEKKTGLRGLKKRGIGGKISKTSNRPHPQTEPEIRKTGEEPFRKGEGMETAVVNEEGACLIGLNLDLFGGKEERVPKATLTSRKGGLGGTSHQRELRKHQKKHAG